MILKGQKLAAYERAPDPEAAGLLLYGADATRIDLKRQQIIKTLLGPSGADEMRLTRMSGAQLRKDPAMLVDAVKAIGFFPGARVALVQEVTEAQAGPILDALSAWSEGDAQIVVTAGALKPSSKLRKAFEAHPKTYAAGIYDTPPSMDEIAQLLGAEKLHMPEGAARDLLMGYARALEPGDFRQLIQKLGLFKLYDQTPVAVDDVEAVAPGTVEAEIDQTLLAIGDGQVQELGRLLQRLAAQGVTSVSLLIAAMRHFRSLHRAASDTSGRPQIWGPHRDAMLSQSRRWGPARLETALTVLTDTDLKLRSAGQSAPAFALVERALIRIAMLGGRAGR